MKVELRRLCAITRERAKLAKQKPRHSPEFIRLENMSNRMEQMNKRISTMRQENKEIMENIITMRKFQGQFKIFERDFRRKINYLKSRGQELLDKAVSSYEEKDEFMAKQRVFKDRCSQDLRKTAINENALNLSLQRTEKNDAFADLQATVRTDKRIAEATDMIVEGVTGLEPGMEGMQNLQTAISEAAGEEAPDRMKKSFMVASDSIDMMLSYLNELLRDINSLQEEINSLKNEYKKLTKGISSSDREMRLRIKFNQDQAQKTLEKADEASTSTEEAGSELKLMFDIVKTLYTMSCPEDAQALEAVPIDESNVIDYLHQMEDKLLDYLIIQQYSKIKEVSDEAKPLLLEAENEEDIEDEVGEIEPIGFVQPRTLMSEADLQCLVDLDHEESFLEFKSLTDRAVDAVSEVGSEKSGDERDEIN